jgi:hypothetical protein
MNVLTVLLLTVLVTIPAHAQQQVPKGTEVPEVRKQEGKSAEGQDLRRKVKRKAETLESQKPKGPEIRKQEGKSAEGQDLHRKVKRKAETLESQKPKGPEVRKQESKGTEGSDVPKEQKKQ